MRVVVFVGVSIDGFLARDDGTYDFLKPFEGEEHGYVDLMARIDTLVIGRATYETVLAFDVWPYAGKRVVVLTHRPLATRRGETTHEGSLKPLMARLAREGAHGIYLDGGVAIQAGLEEDVVDEMIVSVVPVTVGCGRPLFARGAPCTRRWTLGGVRSYPSGLVQTQYARVR